MSGGAFWKLAGLNYLQYLSISSRAVRAALKEPAKSKALAREAFFFNKTVGKEKSAITSILPK